MKTVVLYLVLILVPTSYCNQQTESIRLPVELAQGSIEKTQGSSDTTPASRSEEEEAIVEVDYDETEDTEFPIETTQVQTEVTQGLSEEAIVEDDDDDLEFTQQYSAQRQATATQAQTQVTQGPNGEQEAGVEDEAIVEDDFEEPHRRVKRRNTRRRIGVEDYPDITRDTQYQFVHDSTHLHEYQLKLEDEVGVGPWAMRWYHDTTKTIYKNVTIELITLGNVETKNWVTVCPGHNHIKFRVKTGSDAVIYLADRFFSGDTSAFRDDQYDNKITTLSTKTNLVIGAVDLVLDKVKKLLNIITTAIPTPTFGNYLQIRIGDSANTMRERDEAGKPAADTEKWEEADWPRRDQRSYICYNERRACSNYFVRHIHPLLQDPSWDRTSEGKREKYLSCEEYRGFWIWWEPSGMVLVGKENQPPFMVYYVNKFFKKKWEVRAIGFGDLQDHEADKDALHDSVACGRAHYHINILFPIHDDPHFEEHSDELDAQDD